MIQLVGKTHTSLSLGCHKIKKKSEQSHFAERKREIWKQTKKYTNKQKYLGKEEHVALTEKKIEEKPGLQCASWKVRHEGLQVGIYIT